MSTTKSISDLLAIYEQPARISEPNAENLKKLEDAIVTNAKLTRHTAGTGTHGHLGAVISTALFAIRAKNVPAYVPPTEPGKKPDYGTTATSGPTNAQILEGNRLHEAKQVAFETHNNVILAMRAIILNCVPDQYLAQLKCPENDYDHVEPAEMIDHLKENYAKKNVTMLEANDKKMKQPYDITNPMASLWQQLDIGKSFAIGTDMEYSDNQMMHMAQVQLRNTGEFHKALVEWNKKSTTAKTWKNLKTFFNEKYNDLQDERTHARAHGYVNSAQLTEFSNEHLAAVAAATATKEELAQAFAEITELRSALTNLSPNIQANNQAAAAQPGTSQITELQELVIKQQKDIEELKGKLQKKKRPRKPCSGNYCWTHGFRVWGDHTSMTCRRPAEGHKREATKDNMMGGSSETIS